MRIVLLAPLIFILSFSSLIGITLAAHANFQFSLGIFDNMINFFRHLFGAFPAPSLSNVISQASQNHTKSYYNISANIPTTALADNATITSTIISVTSTIPSTTTVPLVSIQQVDTYFKDARTNQSYASSNLTGFAGAAGSVKNFSFIINNYEGIGEYIINFSVPAGGFIINGVKPSLPTYIAGHSNQTFTLGISLPTMQYSESIQLFIYYYYNTTMANIIIPQPTTTIFECANGSFGAPCCSATYQMYYNGQCYSCSVGSVYLGSNGPACPTVETNSTGSGIITLSTTTISPTALSTSTTIVSTTTQSTTTIMSNSYWPPVNLSCSPVCTGIVGPHGSLNCPSNCPYLGYCTEPAICTTQQILEGTCNNTGYTCTTSLG